MLGCGRSEGEVWGSAGEMWRKVGLWGSEERCGKCVGHMTICDDLLRGRDETGT